MAFLSHPLGGAEGEQDSFKVALQLTHARIWIHINTLCGSIYTVHMLSLMSHTVALYCNVLRGC